MGWGTYLLRLAIQAFHSICCRYTQTGITYLRRAQGTQQNNPSTSGLRDAYEGENCLAKVSGPKQYVNLFLKMNKQRFSYFVSERSCNNELLISFTSRSAMCGAIVHSPVTVHPDFLAQEFIHSTQAWFHKRNSSYHLPLHHRPTFNLSLQMTEVEDEGVARGTVWVEMG